MCRRYPVTRAVLSVMLVCVVLAGCTDEDSGRPTGTVAAPDTIAPRLDLSFTHKTVEWGGEWEPPEASAVDAKDGVISKAVTSSGRVDPCEPGVYRILYTVSDSSGNQAAAVCTVTVRMPASTVLYLPLDGSVADNGQNRLAGVNHGAKPAVNRRGEEARAMGFDGTSYIEFAYNRKLDIPDSFAVCAWARSAKPGSAYSNDGYICDMGFAADNGYGIRFVTAVQKVCPYYNYQPRTGTGLPALDTLWHHYVLQYDGRTLSYYVDGTRLVRLAVGTGSIADNAFRVGAQSKQVERYWYGEIDDLVFLSGTISESRIRRLASDTVEGHGRYPPSDTVHSDTTRPDTTSRDTTHTDTTRADTVVVTGLAAAVSGSAGSLTLKLTWTAVPGVMGYGVYFNEGKSVSAGDAFRVSVSNARTFSSELTEGKEYTFAVTCTRKDGSESALSKPLTVLFAPK